MLSKAPEKQQFETYGIAFFAKSKRYMQKHWIRLMDRLLAQRDVG
jgi:hypothetical protein